MSEARSDSIYKRLQAAGKLDATMRTLLDAAGDDSLAVPTTAFVKMARSLKLDGIQTSPMALHKMVAVHGWPWRCKTQEEDSLEGGGTGHLDTDGKDMVRKRLRLLAFRDLSLKELILLAKVDTDTEKVRVLQARLQLSQNEAERKILETKLKGAALIDDVLNEAAKLERLRQVHSDSKAAGESTARRLEAIINHTWGEAAA